MTIKGIIQAIKKGEVGYKISKKTLRYFESRKSDLLSFASKYVFDNRQSGSENLLLVLLGFQPYYWDVVLERVKKNVEQFDEQIDVCLCVPFGENKDASRKVRELAQMYNFSYLFIYEDLLAQALNTAIKLHPNAQWIYKIDEDIILSDNYFSKMKTSYLNYTKESYYPIGFISPLINVNAGGFRIFLESIGKWDDFVKKFPNRYYWGIHDSDDIIHRNKLVAEYLWSLSIPFDQTASMIEERNKQKYSVCPIRMSIGSILFTRNKWKEWGYFEVKGIGVMGAEEAQICAYTINYMQSIVIAEDVFAGHLGFFRQKNVCRKFFEEHINEIKHK